MDPAMLAQLEQDYVKNLATMAAGTGGNPDIFTAELHQQLTQAWLGELPDA